MLTIAISSRSLFQLEASNKIFEEFGQEAFDKHMLENEDVLLAPGAAFGLIKKLLGLNKFAPSNSPFVRVVLLSRNSPDASLQIMRSVNKHKLEIHDAAFTAGRNRFDYAKQFNADLFLSACAEDAFKAIQAGIAAASIRPSRTKINQDESDGVIRIAFDGDSVLFGDESDQVYRANGLDAFHKHEHANSDVTMTDGPLKNFLVKLAEIQNAIRSQELPDENPIRIALVTARSVQVHARVIRTLRSWGIKLDEAVFANGAPKGPLLKAFKADFFFDDTGKHIDSALDHDIDAAHVPFGQGGITRPASSQA